MPDRGTARSQNQSFKRAYQACINCRQRKVKCILESNGQGILQSSCTRCQRELRKCTFDAERRTQSTSSSNNIASTLRTVQTTESLSHVDINREGHNRSSEGTLATTAFSYPFNASYAHGSPDRNYAPGRPRKRRRGDAEEADASEDNGGASDGEVASAAVTHDPLPTSSAGSQTLRDESWAHGQNATSESPNFISSDSSCLSRTEHTSQIWTTIRHPLVCATQETIEVWNQWRFVKSGLITALEAITYIHLFFKNMSSLSPILNDYYSNHSTHQCLISKEPVLCSTIVALSARYHILAGEGGLSRGYYIHERLWKHCKSLFHQIVWDQRRMTKNQIKHLGTIESFLLVTEWHPRSAHLPIEDEDWQADNDIADDGWANTHSKVPNKWLRDVEEIAQRSDRMSWMLIGSALTLSHELDLFDSQEDLIDGASDQVTNLSFENYLLLRRRRIKRLLFVYISQLASRVGCTLPKTPFHDTIVSAISAPEDPLDREWHIHMSSWAELSRLIRTSSEFLFPSKAVTRELVKSGRYREFVNHFQPLLAQWRDTYSRETNCLEHGATYHRCLMIDYHFVCMYINSLALQASAGKSVRVPPPTTVHTNAGQDSSYIHEVMNNSQMILQTVISLARDNQLKYIPVRLYIRIASAAVYLINAIALGVNKTRLEQSLSLLDRTVKALYCHAVDDVHLGVRFASLLRNSLKGLHQRFIRVGTSINVPVSPFYDTDFRSGQNSEPTEGTQAMEKKTNLSLTSNSIERAPRVWLGEFDESHNNSHEPEEVVDLPSEPLGLTLSGNDLSSCIGDWFILPIDASAENTEDTFMQTFFEVGHTDERFFWDISL
ncbi:hypothetical protein F5884DRAFT_318925 [Xylogone sp. PMI_703]|nr:hypothetical protein F5884DRAFT_318925 [Xylogone sp. PMI_703]